MKNLEQIRAANALVQGPRGSPRAFATGLRRLVAELAHAPTAVVFVVHDEPRWQRFGGNAARALAHAVTLRIACQPLGLVVHRSGDVLGLRLRATVVKHRLAAPGRSAELEVWRDRGIHVAAELVDLGLAHGLIAPRPPYRFAGVEIGRAHV